MLAKICFAFFCALAIRSLFLMAVERKPAIMKLLDLLYALFFSAVAFVLFVVLRNRIMDQPLITIAVFTALFVVVSFLLNFRLRRPYLPRPAWMLLKVLLVLFFVCLSLVALMMSGFHYLTEDRPIVKVVLTGNQKAEIVEWQPPNEVQRKEPLNTYEVIFETPEGEKLSEQYVYGDQVAIKAKTIRFKPMLNVIGIQNVCRIDYVHNGYVTTERFNTYPHHAWKLESANPWIEPFQEPFWNYWEDLFRGKENAVVKSATLESNYFPLVYADGSPYKGSYFLTITPGGLSSVPLP
jgi:hypothetical protein